MRKNYIVINGKKAELTEEQLKQLGIKVESNYSEIFDRKTDEEYYYISEIGNLHKTAEKNAIVDDRLYKMGNYCRDKDLVKQRAMHETLSRLLWRFTYKNGWSENLWKDSKTSKYFIFYDEEYKKFNTITVMNEHAFGAPCFKTKKIAERAIDEIIEPFMEDHPDFVW